SSRSTSWRPQWGAACQRRAPGPPPVPRQPRYPPLPAVANAFLGVSMATDEADIVDPNIERRIGGVDVALKGSDPMRIERRSRLRTELFQPLPRYGVFAPIFAEIDGDRGVAVAVVFAEAAAFDRHGVDNR